MFFRSVGTRLQDSLPRRPYTLNDYGRKDLKRYWRFLFTEILDVERQHGVSSQWIYDRRLIFHELRVNSVGTRLLHLVKKDLSYIHRCLENRILSNSFQPADRTLHSLCSWAAT
jgi:hypothetical protein